MPPHLYRSTELTPKSSPPKWGRGEGEGDVEESTGLHYFCEAQLILKDGDLSQYGMGHH
jgi:hypothetical protein